MKYPKICILSGWACSTEPLAGVIPAGTEYSVIAYQKGIKQAIPGYRDAVIEALASEKEPVTLLGWSLGAMTAIETAFAVPEKITALILAGGTARFTANAEYSAGIAPVIVKRMMRSMERNAAATLDDFFGRIVSDEEAQFAENIPSLRGTWTDQEHAAGLEYLLHQDLRPLLPQLSIPVFVLHGSRDLICPVSAGEFLKNNLKNAALHIFPGAGHAPFMSRQEKFRSGVSRWFNELNQ